MMLGTECSGSGEAELIERSLRHLIDPYSSNFLLVQSNSLDDLKKKQKTIHLQKMTFLALCLQPPGRFYSSLLLELTLFCSTSQHMFHNKATVRGFAVEEVAVPRDITKGSLSVSRKQQMLFSSEK